MLFNVKKNSGFTLTEISVSLIFVTLGILLVGSLAQQVSKLSVSTKQVGAVIELRNKANAISRDTSAWLQKLRSQVSVNGVGIYSGCIPDNYSGISTYSCPATDSTILANDSELNKIAKGLHVIDTPLVDIMGNPIAGTLAAPLYLDSEGRPCTEANAARPCAFKSTGYFLRKNAATNANPQEVSFVLKIEKNNQTLNASNNTPMKAQYMVIEIGKQWLKPVDSAQTCDAGTVKVGYLADGKPQCLSATHKCDSNKVQLGIDESGAPICAVKPTTCLPADYIVYDGASKSLTCSANSPCTNGTFVGYYSGTGQPMCYQSNPPCGTGSIQVGQTNNGPAQCVSITSCTAEKPFLTFNGSVFVCSSAPDDSRMIARAIGPSGPAGVSGTNGNTTPSTVFNEFNLGNNMCGGTVVIPRGINPEQSQLTNCCSGGGPKSSCYPTGIHGWDGGSTVWYVCSCPTQMALAFRTITDTRKNISTSIETDLKETQLGGGSTSPTGRPAHVRGGSEEAFKLLNNVQADSDSIWANDNNNGNFDGIKCDASKGWRLVSCYTSCIACNALDVIHYAEMINNKKIITGCLTEGWDKGDKQEIVIQCVKGN